MEGGDRRRGEGRGGEKGRGGGKGGEEERRREKGIEETEGELRSGGEEDEMLGGKERKGKGKGRKCAGPYRGSRTKK